MTQRRAWAGWTSVLVLVLALLGPEQGAEAGPIRRRFEQWAVSQPQVSAAQPSTTKTIDLDFTRTSWTQRARQWPTSLMAKTRAGAAMVLYRSKVPKGVGPRQLWRKSPSMGEFKMTTETMKHRSDGTLIR